MQATLVIIGAGGHGRVVADAARAAGWARLVATDADPARCQGELLPTIPLMLMAEALALSNAAFHIAIGRADAREREAARLGERRLLATIAHPEASVSPYARLGAGSFIAAQAVVAPGADLGRCCIINHGAVVDHDVAVGDYAHIAPRAVLGGGVRIGQRVLVGAGATVLPGLQVVDGATIGAGAVVCAPLTEPAVVAGVPARRIR